MSKWTDEQIRELCDKATEGPWEWHTVHGPLVRKLPEGDRTWHPAVLGLDITIDGDQEITTSKANAAFIAAARELVPQLLDRAQRAEAQLDMLLDMYIDAVRSGGGCPDVKIDSCDMSCDRCWQNYAIRELKTCKLS